MTEGPYTYRDESGSRRWIILLIFLLLVGFMVAGAWFFLTQNEGETRVDIAAVDTAHPSLEPLPEAVSIDRLPVSDEQAVADGTLRRFDDNRWLESDRFVGADTAGRTAELRIYILSQDYSWEFGDGRRLTEIGRAHV